MSDSERRNPKTVNIGERGVHVGRDSGDIVIGNNSKTVRADNYVENLNIRDIPRPAPSALREAYLNRLRHNACSLTLAGVDPKAAGGGPEACLDLGAVYTALLTRSGDAMGEEGKPGRKTMQRGDSALEVLDREARLVLMGDPGSGKSTFVNFVAACLAGEAVGDPKTNIGLLTHPLPKDDGEDEEKPQPWSRNLLLPVRVILRDFAARGLPADGQEADGGHLWRFLRRELAAAELTGFEGELKEELLERGGLLLLDGLDEVPDAEGRRAGIKRSVEDFIGMFPRCRVLVTSRTYAYQKQQWRLNGFSEAVLAPFSGGQIRRFIARWYDHMAEVRGMEAEDAKGRAELLRRAVFGSDRLLALAERPLLLTLMASLHAWRGGSLPEKREQLYADAVDLLLDWWESPKIVHRKEGRAEVRQPSLAEWLRVDRDRMRERINALAFSVHASQKELTGTADINGGTLVGGLLDLSRNPDAKPGRLVEYLSERAGLLVPRGVNVYAFPHRTFQEYLAACHLTDDPEYPDVMADLARADPNRWREVALLAGAKAAKGNAPSVWGLAEALCMREPDDPVAGEPDIWGAQIAGQLLMETANLDRVSDRHRPKLERVVRWMLRIIRGEDLPAFERALAGRALAVLGDPRDEVMKVDAMRFCMVPAGPFVMGSVKGEDPHADEDELPQHEVDLETFWISGYPVTQAQFAEFVRAGGYGEAELWPEAEAHGVWKDGAVKGWDYFDKAPRCRPFDFGFPFHLPNHPVVGVTWYEAVAFTRWLTRKWIQEGIIPKGWEVRLPSEAEWEKTGRGGKMLPPGPSVLPAAEVSTAESGSAGEENLSSSRIHPWGNTPDGERANMKLSEIGTTSAVGCFPDGKTKYGAEGMIGNVFEWTRSIFKDYPYGDDGKDREDIRKVERSTVMTLRGGCFGNDPDWARCAFRLRSGPLNLVRDSGFRVVLSPFL